MEVGMWLRVGMKLQINSVYGVDGEGWMRERACGCH